MPAGDKTIMSGKKEEKDGCASLWQGYYGSIEVITFPVFQEKHVQQVALGGDHCLFLTRDGEVYACGKNSHGQLGIGDLEKKEVYDPVLIDSLTDKGITFISCGSNHCAAVTKNGEVYCWGDCKEGQCGVPEGSNEISDGLVSVPYLVEIIKPCDEVCDHGNTGPIEKIVIRKIACGKSHTVALSNENEIWVWGSGIALGVEPASKTVKPIQVETLIGRNVQDVICGELYTVAVVEKSVFDDTPVKKRSSDLVTKTHKYFPDTCAKCNEEIYSYMEKSDMCIISENHVCPENSESLDNSQSLVHLAETNTATNESLMNNETLSGTSENDQTNLSSMKTEKSNKPDDCLKKSDNEKSESALKKVDVNLEENSSMEGSDKICVDKKPADNGNVLESPQLKTVDGLNSQEGVSNNGDKQISEVCQSEGKVDMTQSYDDIWKKQPPKRSPSSKSESAIVKSKSLIDEKNARQFLAKQLDEDTTDKAPLSNKELATAGFVVKDRVTDIWSSVQTGVQTAYAIPGQMTGMLGSFKATIFDRMASSSAEEKEDTGSSMDSNLHLVEFDTSDEDVFRATQLVEHQLSQKDIQKNQTDDSKEAIAESSFVEGIKAEMLLLDESKTEEKGDITLEEEKLSGETISTPKYQSMRTILAKKEELERKSSTRSVLSTTEDEMKRPSVVIDTEVWSWGKNNRGQLGVGDMIDRPLPTIVKAMSNKRVVKVCCGTSHTMALTANSQVYSWGNNSSGQLGRKEETALPNIIKMVPGCYIWDIAAGDCYSIFLIDRTGFQPEVFFVGKHPTKDLYVPIHSTNRLTSLNFLKQAGWIRNIIAGGDNCSCISCYSFSGYLMTLFEIAATERKFHFHLHKIFKLLLDPLQKSPFYTSLDVFPYKSTLQNLLSAFNRIVSKVCESLVEMTRMISSGEDLLHSSLFTNYSRYTVEFKRYYMALSDMLAVGGFEYICKIGSSFFDKDTVSKSLKELLPPDTRIERATYHFLLIQILESPVNHIKEFINLSEKLGTYFMQDSDEYNMLHRVSLNWSSLRHTASTELEVAEATRAFWEENKTQKLADAVKIPSRRLIKDSKKKPLSLQGGGRFSSHIFLLFNDMFIHVQGYTFQVFQLETLWVEAPSGGKLENMLVLTFPEDKLVLTAASSGERAEWLMTLNAAVNKVLSSQKSVARRGSMERLTPPDIRHATFSFTKHGLYKDATYLGYWMKGKVHGLGEIKWSDGRKYIGNFKDGFQHGHGKLFIKQDDGSERTQEGHWKDGQLHGMGKVKYSNGDIFDGHFKEGQRHGHGVYNYGGLSPRSTSVYIGEWVDDKKQGYGVMDDIMKGEKYMGMWHEDMRHGKGIVVTLDGMYFEGNFDKDNLVGFGLMLTYDNSCYEGEFYGITQLQGKGKLIMPTGDFIEGIFSGSWNEGLKINGMFKKTTSQHDCQKSKMKLHIPSSHYGKMSVPADRKWDGMFRHCQAVFGIKPRQDKPDSSKAWEGVAIMVSKGRQVVHEMKMSGSSKWRRYQGSFVEEIEKIPPHNIGSLTTEYYSVIQSYLTRAFEISFHPLGKLMDGLVDVFRAAYIGIGAHPRLLGHAVAEVNSYVRRIYVTVRLLFPDLPENGGPLQIRSEKFVDYDSDEETEGVISLNKQNENEKEIVSAGSLLHPILLPKIYPPLFDLYALYNDKMDDKYWERIKKLNKQGDVALLAYLGVDQKFWLLDESFFTDKKSSLSNLRDHCYISAIERLQQISTAFSPKEKLQVIRDSFTEITETVQSSLGEEHIWCMDELFPIFQYVVVRAQIRHLGAEVHYIEDLMERFLENGELGIMFTTLYACYYQIQNEKIPSH